MGKQNQATAAKPPSVTKHILSFVVMIVLTAIAFYLVANDVMSIQLLIPILIGLAAIQVVLQLYIFMHLDQKGQTFPIFFMVVGIAIAVISVLGILLM